MSLADRMANYFSPAHTRRHPVTRRCPLRLEALEDRTVPTLLGNQLFPADNPWNQKITNAPVAANSATLVAAIGAASPLHPDFGTTYAGSFNGFSLNVVSAGQPLVNVVIDDYPAESDVVPIPIPDGAQFEGDPLPSDQNHTDRHLLVYDRDRNVVYETYNTRRPSETSDGKWHASSEAVWDLSKNTFRTPGYTSADAAGLPILPGLVRPDEVLDQGVINHAIRFTVPASRNAYVYPASHHAGSANVNLPRMGERFRLKQSFDISGYPAADRVILQALKDYGMIVADNGGAWFMSGQTSPRWDDGILHSLKQVPGSAFDAVDLTPVVAALDKSSGPAGTSVTITGVNFTGTAGQTQVYFGSTPAASFTVVNDTQIVAVAPALASGTVVDVTVRSPYGTSVTSAADRFTFSDGTPPVLTANQKFVSRLYLDLLQRAADSGGLAAWSGLLDRGTARSAVVRAFQYSTEARGVVVNGLYQQFLGRAADAGGKAGWVAYLQGGGTVEQLEVAILGSVEYLARSGGTNAAFLSALYNSVLGRAIDAGGAQGWGAVLNQGLVSRAFVAQAVLGSGEGCTVRVNAWYQSLLRRQADPAGRAGFVQAMQMGMTGDQVVGIILGSDEYYAKA